MLEFTGQDILFFIKELRNDESCKAYLAKIKWQDGFTFSKCGHTKGCEKAGYNYHCYSCHHLESATANTLFHKVKFGLQKAFCVVFEMSTSSKSCGISLIRQKYWIAQIERKGYF
jgi:hypothetical protein